MPTSPQSSPTRPQWLCLLRLARPDMLTTGPTAVESAAVDAHFDYVSGLTEEGVMILVGRTQTAGPDTLGVAIFEAEDIEAARAIVDADPAVVAGVMVPTLLPYRVALSRQPPAARGALERCGHETLGILQAGSYSTSSGKRVHVAEAIAAAQARTHLLHEDDLRAAIAADASAATLLSSTTGSATRVHLWNLRSGACAARLLREGAKKVAVLNYANSVRPGGGFLRGARAQEEALCRCSGLYACLSQARPDVRFFYDDHVAQQSPLARDHILVSPDVPFFRDEDLALLEAPFVATVLTAAAPDLNWLSAATREGVEPLTRYDELPAVFRRRARMVLYAAARAGCDAVVVGPWGCGAFGNDPVVVADAFADATDAAAGCDTVVCATWGPDDNRAAFERRFRQAST